MVLTIKQKLFLDFDNTITNSIQAYCSTYNCLYWNRDGFIKADYTKETKWNLQTTCPLAKDNVNDIFDSELFFTFLRPYPNAFKCIELLSNEYQIIIATIGTLDNLSYKADWIKNNMPFIDDCILLHHGYKCPMDKSIIDMSNGVFVDDHQSNLYSSNADTKICFSFENREYDWNNDWKGKKVGNWMELTKYLL